jgi:hypothetical protein
MTNVFERVYTDETPDAVTVRVFVVDGQTVAEADWDPIMGSYGMVVGPALGNPHEEYGGTSAAK